MGGWCFRKKQISGTDQFHTIPDKNRYSHVGEACEYMLIGGGEGKLLIHVEDEPDPDDKDIFDYNIDVIDNGAGATGQGWMA